MPTRAALLGLFVVTVMLSAARRAVAADPPSPPVTVESPADYQVFQRRSSAGGTIVIAGRATGGGGLEYRVAGGDWRPLEVDPKTRAFRHEHPAAAGGWYRVEIRATENPAAVTAVAHVGVGEVFVVAGQSNSTNYGAEKQKPASELVVAFDGTTWAPAADPQPGTYDKSKGGSFIPAFGDALATRYKVPIAIACTGNGATSVRQWLPKGEKVDRLPTIDAFMKKSGPGEWESTGELYDHLMKRVAALGPQGFRAVLWHQGESDAGQARAGYPADRQITGAQYRAYLETLIRASRKQGGWEVPWFVARATYHSESDPADEEFRAAQAAVGDGTFAHAGPDTDALRKEYRAGVHFNGKGQVAHGALWAEKVGAFVDEQLRPTASQPASRPAAAAPAPQAAKQAIVDFIRAHPGAFVGSPDADRLAALPLVDRGGGTYTFGAIYLNPGEKWYRVTLDQGPAGLFDYAGTLVERDGAWSASAPKATHVRPRRE